MEPTPLPADQELLDRFVNRGDRDALGALAERHEVALLGLARGLLGGNHALAQEAVQNTWVKVIRYGRSFGGRCAVRTWLYRITINQCRTLRARSATSAPRSHDAPRTEPTAPVDTGESSELRGRVAKALESLPEPQREVLLLCYHAEVTHHHAAEVIGVPIGTLKSRLHSALAALRTALAQEQTR